MLDAKDLRIGNLIKWISTNTVEVVQEINSCGKYHLINNVQITDAEPIELTEEWLLIFGFEVDDDLGDQIYYQIPNQKNGYGICFDHDDIAFYKFYGNGGENVHTLIHDEEHLQYVHQLQNIYYALTQTELTLKDEK